MISILLDALPPDQWLTLREAFENEESARFNVPKTEYWVGVNIPTEVTTLAREGLFAYGKKA